MYTLEEAINLREEKLAEERKINLAIKILESDSVPINAGVKMALSQYRKRLDEIKAEITDIAYNVKPAIQEIEIVVDEEISRQEMISNLVNLAKQIMNDKDNGLMYKFVVKQ